VVTGSDLQGYFVMNSAIPVIIFFASAAMPSLSFAQSFEVATESVSAAPQPPPLSPPPLESKRILGIIPNNRTWPSLTNYQPLTTKQKFKIAQEDSFDRGTLILAAAFAADAQMTNANRVFGQGVKGYASILAHRTPTSSLATTCRRRFTRRSFTRIHAISGVATGAHGLGWGMPSGKSSGPTPIRIGLNSITRRSLAIRPRSRFSNAYYQDNRSAANSGTKFGMQIGVDMASNVLKEFWPDVSRKFRKHSQ
jgi:hypothetical protein